MKRIVLLLTLVVLAGCEPAPTADQPSGTNSPGTQTYPSGSTNSTEQNSPPNTVTNPLPAIPPS